MLDKFLLKRSPAGASIVISSMPTNEILANTSTTITFIQNSFHDLREARLNRLTYSWAAIVFFLGDLALSDPGRSTC